MRHYFFILFAFIGLSGCLNNDVLDEDFDDTNFKESDFYTSGEFDNQFGFTVESVQLRTIRNPQDPSDTLCEPTYTLHLNNNFAKSLEQEWSHQIAITLYRDEVDPPVEFFFDSDYGQSFKFRGKAIECFATSSDFDARIVLTAPNTGRATAAIDRKTITITFTP